MKNQNNLLKRVKSVDGNHSEMISTQCAQGDNFINPINTTLKIVMLIKVLRLTQGTSFSLWKMKLKGVQTAMN